MKAESISVDTGLLLGEITDTNASQLAQQLSLLGSEPAGESLNERMPRWRMSEPDLDDLLLLGRLDRVMTVLEQEVGSCR
jgi:hypothetical protein